MDRLTLPCDCAGTCGIALFMEFEAIHDQPQEFFVEFYTAPAAGRGLCHRLKHAWAAIRNREPYVHAVCWTTPEQPEQLRDWLTAKLATANGREV